MRNQKPFPASHFGYLYSQIPQLPANITLTKHIHIEMTWQAINNHPLNLVLNTTTEPEHPGRWEGITKHESHFTIYALDTHPSLDYYKHQFSTSQNPSHTISAHPRTLHIHNDATIIKTPYICCLSTLIIITNNLAFICIHSQLSLFTHFPKLRHQFLESLTWTATSAMS